MMSNYTFYRLLINLHTVEAKSAELEQILYQSLIDEHGLSMNAIKALLFIAYAPDKDLISEIAVGMTVSPPVASKAVDELAGKGFIEVSVDKIDRRKKHVTLRPGAEAITLKVKNIKKFCDEEVFMNIPDEELKRFDKLFCDVYQNLVRIVEEKTL